jgi:hypothetical protein
MATKTKDHAAQNTMTSADLFKFWANETERDAVRLIYFERWMTALLAEKIKWPDEAGTRDKMIGQCRAMIATAVADLGKHGYLFRPNEIRELLTEALDKIAAYQDSIKDFYPYFKNCWSGWVGRHAEEFRAKAVKKDVLAGKSVVKRMSISQIVLLDLEAKHEHMKRLERFRAEKKQARKAAATQLALF